MSKWLRYFEVIRRNPRRDIDDEIASHLELREADLRARGLSASEAKARAASEFGDASAARLATLAVDDRMMRREQRSEMLHNFVRDARVALRSMRANPGFAISATLCAGLGIGITAAIVAASYAILVKSLPFPDSDRLVTVYTQHARLGYNEAPLSYPDFVDWRDNNRSFTGIAIWNWNTKTLSSDARAEAERVSGADVSWNLFRVLGVRPAIGRDFLAEEDAPGRNYEVILSHRLWQRRFAGDSGIVGKTIPLDGRPWTVIGVMPAGFNFPDVGDLWSPFAAGPNEGRGNRGYAAAIARLKPGVTVAQATADLHRIDAPLEILYPEDKRGWLAEVMPIREDLIGNLRDPVRVLLASVALVLLLACANITNLALARGVARGREIAIRGAIGASRARIVRQLMTESVVIAGVGGILGIAIAWAVLRSFTLYFPRGVPFYLTLGLDARALGVVVIVTIIAAILFGIVPALRGSVADLNTALRAGTQGGSDRARLRSAIVVAEVALSAILMTGALLLMRSYRKLHDTPLGFTPSGIVSARLTLPRNAGYPTKGDVKQFYDRLFERLRADPAVASVGAAQGAPQTGWDLQAPVNVEGMPTRRGSAQVIAHFQNVSSEYFRTIGVPLVRGRWLDATDRDSLNPKVLITQSVVDKAFGGADPIGKRVQVGGPGDPWGTVVGVIGDFRQYRLPQDAPPAVFNTIDEFPTRQMTIVMRAKSGDPHRLVPLLRSAVRELDANVALFQVQTLDEAVARALWRERLMGSMLASFAALALAMACLGLYGVVSYMVSSRTRELGVRVALGATRGSIAGLVVGQGARLVAIGIVTGLIGAWFGVRILASLLHGVSTTDPWTFAIVGVGLGAVAMVATAIPSVRAVRVDPIVAMRVE